MSFEEFETREDAIEYCKKNGRSCVSFSLAQNGEELGTFYLELYNTECPKTCAHFLSLVKGNGQYCYKVSISYANVPFVACSRVRICEHTFPQLTRSVPAVHVRSICAQLAI